MKIRKIKHPKEDFKHTLGKEHRLKRAHPKTNDSDVKRDEILDERTTADYTEGNKDGEASVKTLR